MSQNLAILPEEVNHTVTLKVQIITNLYPLPWEPNRAAFNRQQFHYLSRYCSLRVTVPVGWRESRSGNLNTPDTSPDENPRVDYLRYFYIPGIGRFTHAATLACSLYGRKSQITGFRPDCFLLSWAYPDAVAGVMLANRLGIPAVIKVHGSDINLHHAYPLRAAQIRWAMRRARAVISVSQALANKLIALGVDSEKIQVIYNGIDREIFHPLDVGQVRDELGLNATRKRILFVGNLKAQKGCLDLLQAFADIAAEMPELDLLYIGVGHEAEVIAKRAEQLQIGSRVKLLGGLDHRLVARWINAVDVLALPSHNEGVPNVLLEAMACGIPVVATRVGGIPEIVSRQAGILVERGDPGGLSRALREAIATRWDRDAIVESVARFDWDSNVRQVHALLQSVSAGGIPERVVARDH